MTLLNDGTGVFTSLPLPTLAQVSPSYGVVVTEVNGDQHPDIYLVQNFFTAQVETGRMDGGMSLLLLGQGNGSFRPVSPRTSGLVVTGDAKSLVAIDLDATGTSFLVGVNDGELLAFKRLDKGSPDGGDLDGGGNNAKKIATKLDGTLLKISLAGPAGNRLGIGALVQLQLNDGSNQTAEVHAGSGYLSQSTTTLSFGVPTDRTAQQVNIRWPDGTTTRHATSGNPKFTEGHQQQRFIFSHSQVAKETL